MIAAVFKALVTLTLVLFASLGAGTFAVALLLFTGGVSVPQVADVLDSTLAYASYCYGTLGAVAGGATIRAAVPHALAGVRDWFVSAIREEVNNQLK